MDTIAVIDFETTGMAPDGGARAIEIAAVLLRDGRVVDRYQSLMNPGAWVPPFIEQFTGITNRMVRAAPPAAKVMREAAEFVGEHPLAAHNASFDRRFWDAELARIDRRRVQAFACTMLLARRIYPQAPNHRLGTLVEFTRLPVAGRYHRALADAEMTAGLLAKLEAELAQRATRWPAAWSGSRSRRTGPPARRPSARGRSWREQALRGQARLVEHVAQALLDAARRQRLTGARHERDHRGAGLVLRIPGADPGAFARRTGPPALSAAGAHRVEDLLPGLRAALDPDQQSVALLFDAEAHVSSAVARYAGGAWTTLIRGRGGGNDFRRPGLRAAGRAPAGPGAGTTLVRTG